MGIGGLDRPEVVCCEYEKFGPALNPISRPFDLRLSSS